jgi:hypothetical protein
MTRMARIAAVVSTALALAADAARADAAATTPVILQASPGTVTVLGGAPALSFVDLDAGTCIQPSVVAPIAIAMPDPAPPQPGYGWSEPWFIGAIGFTLIAMTAIVSYAAWKVREKALDVELGKMSLRERRTPAEEVASHCALILSLLKTSATSNDEIANQRARLEEVYEVYRKKAAGK